jgi:hypothetical protein
MVRFWAHRPAGAAYISEHKVLKCMLLSVVICLACYQISFSQSSPIGSWQSHFNYKSAHQVIETSARIYGASYNGFFSISKTGEDFQTLGKEDGFSETGIASLGWEATTSTLLIAYRSGNLDIVTLNTEGLPEKIAPWLLFESSADLPENINIRKIVFENGLAYLATNFGIMVVDVGNREVLDTYRYIGANGTQANVKDISLTRDSIYIVTTHGLQSTTRNESVNRQYFANWKPIITPGTALAISSDSNHLYAGISGKGIYQKTATSWTLIYPSESAYYAFTESSSQTIATIHNAIVTITEAGLVSVLTNELITSPRLSVANDSRQYWVADSKNGLTGNPTGTFRNYSPADTDTTINPRPDSIITDRAGMSWTRLPSYLGGGILVKNPANNREKLISTITGSGGLPSSNINSIAIDQEGYIWFASDRGVGFVSSEDLFTTNSINAILPVYGQRRLFANERCTAIAVEAGNRKWIGTRNGLYLFNADGTEQISYFNQENSPLPSSQISTLEFHSETGRLYVDTPAGMVSYQTQSLAPSDNLNNVSIFPNPVRPGFSGLVGIKGLPAASRVKITQMSGRLVFETIAEGGLATWSLNDYTGKRAAGGIYLIFVVSPNGDQQLAGKLAIID